MNHDTDHEAAIEKHANALESEEPLWIVNTLGELGVRVNGRCFFIYKGDNIEYGNIGETQEERREELCHDDDSLILYRAVGKREFGETQWPDSWLRAGRREDQYDVPCPPGIMSPPDPNGEYEWKPLPTTDKAEVTPPAPPQPAPEPTSGAAVMDPMTIEERIAQLERRVSQLESRYECPKCNNPAEPEHSCPYDNALRDGTKRCTCCDECRANCAQAI